MAENVELKARVVDLAACRAIAERLVPGGPEVLQQTDTYFRCAQGRLKLRQRGKTAELIWYDRADSAGPKTSRYELVPVPDPNALSSALSQALEVWAVVKKQREVYLFENVRIHLDEVDRLGAYLEFEAVLSQSVSAAAGRDQVLGLAAQFGILERDLIDRSYSDLVAELGEFSA